MSHNTRLILQLPRHSDHTPTPLPDIVISHNEFPPIQAPLIPYQWVAVQVQLEDLAIDVAQEQDAEEDHAVEIENIQADHVEDFGYEEETPQM
ncbi:hypothetical protein BGZ90_012137 [Linnemannia elongata]|nr:hypothetical protein BGZ90_012137 [Linnemannia elongata]